MVKEVTRHVKSPVERELWARAAGRCQFSGCNKRLFKSSVTQETVNLSQKAHIYSFSEKGPRGWGPFKLKLHNLNDISNLMLMCHECHKTIDQDDSGERYSAELLISWKAAHEQRVEIVTGITPDKKSHVILYGANISSEKSPIDYHSCIEAMFPHWYPASENPVRLSMGSELKDRSSEYWSAESHHLIQSFKRKILPLIEDDVCKNFSVFSLAPQPLLIQLGALFTDKISVETYQLHREPKSWQWQNQDDEFSYIIEQPSNFQGPPALVLALSDHISNDRIHSVLGDNAAIWKVTLANPHNNFMRSKHQLYLFMKEMRKLMVDIKKHHGRDAPLHVFPAMPVSCALELGRVRMPKADMPWIIFDHDISTQTFVESIRIEGDLHEQK